MITKGKLRMLQLGMGPKKLAHKLGISETYVSAILSGRVRPAERLLEQIASVLDLDPGEIQRPLNAGQSN